MAEHWRQIQQFQEEAKRQAIKVEQEREQRRLAAERQFGQQRQDEERLRESQTAEEERKIGAAVRVVLPILEDIRNNAKEVREAPKSAVEVINRHTPPDYSDTTYVYLKWGKKLAMTDEERDIVEKYPYRIDGVSGMFIANRLPKEFVPYDYCEIGVGFFKYQYVSQGGEVGDINDLLLNPGILIPMLGSQLMRPRILRTTYRKGAGYWETKPPIIREEPPRQ